MKKAAIFTLLATLLVSAILVFGAQTGATGGDGADWTAALTEIDSALPTVISSDEIVEETATAIASEATTGETLQKSVPTSATLPAPQMVLPQKTAAISTSLTTQKTIAQAVPSPATAAQTTTATRYVSPQALATTTTTQYVAPVTSATRAPTTITTTSMQATITTTLPTTTRPTTVTTTTTATQAKPDFEAMGQAAYQDEAIRALNALRAERGLQPMTVNASLMSTSLAQAQKMAAAGTSFHSEENLPGCESVCRVPYNFPAKLMGETLAKHVTQFLESSRTSVGVAVVRQGNYLYAVMQGN